MKNLDEEILKLYPKLEKLSYEKKRFYHVKSVQNITKHLLKNNEPHKKLQRFSITRKKELLLEYLSIVFLKEEGHTSKYYYDNYVSKLGRFMNSYYGFSYCGGKIIILFLSIYIFVGAALDIAGYVFFDRTFFFWFLFLLLGISRAVIKNYQKKTYGPNW